MTYIWTAWLAGLAGSFAALEYYAIKHDLATLSQFIADLNKHWPLTSTLFGVLMGGLAVHFFWHWNPK